ERVAVQVAAHRGRRGGVRLRLEEQQRQDKWSASHVRAPPLLGAALGGRRLSLDRAGAPPHPRPGGCRGGRPPVSPANAGPRASRSPQRLSGGGGEPPAALGLARDPGGLTPPSEPPSLGAGSSSAGAARSTARGGGGRGVPGRGCSAG